MSRIGNLPGAIISDDGLRLEGLLHPNGNKSDVITNYGSLQALVADWQAGKLPSGGGGFRVGNTVYTYDGTNLYYSDGKKLVRAVGNPCTVPQFVNLSTALGLTGQNYTLSYSQHMAHGNINMIGIAAANWGIHNTGSLIEDVLGTNPMTIQAAIEYPIGGTRTPLTFSGNATGNCPAGQTISSDLVALNIPDGSPFRVWQQRYCADGWIGDFSVNFTDQGDVLNYNNTGNFGGATVTSGTISQGGYYYGLGIRPLCIFGITDVPRPAVALIGDSRVDGVQDPDYSRFRGCLDRILGPMFATSRIGQNGEKLYNWVTGGNAAKRIALVNKYFTHIVSDFGVNDIYGGTYTTVAQLITAINSFDALFTGQPLFMCTLPPETTSTDNWVTATNQTISNTTYNTLRVAYNNMLRSAQQTLTVGNVPNITGYFELANDVECNSSGVLTQDGGYWLPNPATVTASMAGNTLTVTANLTGTIQTGGWFISATGTGTFPAVNGDDIVQKTGTNTYLFNPNAGSYTFTSGTVTINNGTPDGIHESSCLNRLHALNAYQKFPLNLIQG